MYCDRPLLSSYEPFPVTENDDIIALIGAQSLASIIERDEELTSKAASNTRHFVLSEDGKRRRAEALKRRHARAKKGS